MLLKSMSRHKYLLLLMLPGIIYFLIFRYGPMYGIILAFKEYDISAGIFQSPWAGLKYFRQIFEMQGALNPIKNTIEISLLRIVFQFPIPIIFAILLNEIRSNSFKKTIQTISYMPYFLSWVIVWGIMVEILSPTRGLAAYILDLLGKEPVVLLTSQTYFRPILILSDIWKTTGWGAVVYLASMAGIDVQQYEAATIDGAGKLKQILHITLPGLMPVITILFLMQITSILNAGFEQIFILYTPLTYDTADIIDTFIYRRGLEGMEYSFSTAVNLCKNLIGFVLLVSANYITKKFNEYTIW